MFKNNDSKMAVVRKTETFTELKIKKVTKYFPEIMKAKEKRMNANVKL